MIKHVKRSLILAIIASILLVSSVSAIAYVVLTWHVNTTVVANPCVCFVWQSNGTKANMFTYSGLHIFPSITTIDENATCGVENFNDTSRACHMRLASTTGVDEDLTSFNVTLYNSTATIFTHSWTAFTTPDTDWYDFTAAASAKYTIEIKIVCKSGATPGHTPTFTLEMKVENT